jgi:hypothetical protein
MHQSKTIVSLTSMAMSVSDDDWDTIVTAIKDVSVKKQEDRSAYWSYGLIGLAVILVVIIARKNN